jgi:hypothetical protein
MRRFITAVLLTTGTVAAIWLGVPGDSPNRVATCSAHLTDEALDIAADAGFFLKRNVQLRFPVVRQALADGGLSFDIPPGLARQRDLVEIRDWSDCDIEPASSYPTLATKWDDAVPFVIPGAAARKWCRAKFDAGLLCPLLDGGTFGDRNVSRCSERVAAECERVGSGVITAGEDPETDLQ